MIEHMFESMAGDGTSGDERVAPVSPAMPKVSATPYGCGEAPATCWRETMPGPEMIAALTDVALRACPDEQLLDVLAGWERAAAWLDAQRLRALARTEARLLDTAIRDERDLDGNVDWAAAHRQAETEIGTALHWTSRTTLPRLDLARELTGRLPALLDAMNAGQISCRHAEMICEETDTLTEAQARHLVERLLPEASSKTVPGLRNRLRKAVLQLDPDTANERAKQAVTERCVTIRPLRDGLMALNAIGPADAVLGMFRILDTTADRHSKHDPRTQTARRFDALTDMVLSRADRFAGQPTYSGPAGGRPDPDPGTNGNTPTSSPDSSGRDGGWDYDGDGGWPAGAPDCPPPAKIPALVQITMDLETLLGLRNNPADLHGYGPLPANLARLLAADADWQRFIQDPLTGAPLDLGRTRRHLP